MIGAAAGLAFSGKLPFLCSFGCFLTGRYDTIRLSVAYSQANVRLIGTHAGVGIGDDGHSQMGLEDISLMRALPTMGVFQPADALETERLMEYLVTEWKGPAYVRLTRQSLPDVSDPSLPFQPLKLACVKQVSNAEVVAIGSGAGVAEALKAAEILAAAGVKMAVWNAHSLKPFDEARTREISQGKKLVVTVEDHSVIGGLGSCVAEVLATEQQHGPLIKFGVQDVFGESGEADELYEKHGISGNRVAASILRKLGRA